MEEVDIRKRSAEELIDHLIFQYALHEVVITRLENRITALEAALRDRDGNGFGKAVEVER